VTGLRALAGILMLGSACAASPDVPPYQHSRFDYRSFCGRMGSVPEPNYLPWLTHRERLPDGSEALVLCRWPDRAFPLHYWIEEPVIPEEVQDEFSPKSPSEYVSAVDNAFHDWEREIGRPVRFEPAADPEGADVAVRFEVRMHESPEGLFGGMAGAGSDLCSVLAPGEDEDHVQIRFGVDSISLFIVDSMGLLTPGQVKRIAMHEISRIRELSQHDSNSFRALYRLAPGAVYARLGESHATPMVVARRGPPRLGAEIEDPRFNVRVQFPKGWQVIRTPRGWIAVDGLSWDYDASVQVIGVRGTAEALIDQYGPAYLSQGEFVVSDVLEIDGRLIPRVVVRRFESTEVTSIIEWEEGRLLLVIADSRTENFDLYRPWFQAVLMSLEPLRSLGPAVRTGSEP
jgi:hypothetical protein